MGIFRSHNTPVNSCHLFHVAACRSHSLWMNYWTQISEVLHLLQSLPSSVSYLQRLCCLCTFRSLCLSAFTLRPLLTEIWSLKYFGATTLTFFSVTWRHRSRDHLTRKVRFPRWSIITMRLSCTVTTIWSLELIFWSHDLDILGSRDVIGHVTIGFATYGFL